jgi:hypothetical protein
MLAFPRLLESFSNFIDSGWARVFESDPLNASKLA